MGEAVNLQMLITALAYRYVLQEQVSHRDIPDSPAEESERRQVFFGTAIGIPTFYVYKNSPNRFFRRLLQQVKNTRPSRRYPGYLRVVNKEYRRALLEVLRADAADLIEAMDLTDTLAHLHDRIHRPEESAAVWRMTRGITANTVKPKKPMSFTALNSMRRPRPTTGRTCANSTCWKGLRCCRKTCNASTGGTPGGRAVTTSRCCRFWTDRAQPRFWQRSKATLWRNAFQPTCCSN